MSSTLEYQNKIQRYNNLKVRLNYICNNLSNARKYLNNLTNEINDKYSVNDTFTPIQNKISVLKQNINSTEDILKKTIIPAINSAIYQLNKSLESLE